MKRVIFLILSAAFIMASCRFLGGGDKTPLRVHFLAVGFGDAVLIEFPNGKSMLLDAGDPSQGESLKRFLDRRNIKRLDYFLLTHPHQNHFGGLTALSSMPIGRVFINGELRGERGFDELWLAWRRNGIPVTVLREGGKISGLGKGIRMEALNPARLGNDQNADSLVLKLVIGKRSFLFTGDITEKAQEELLRRWGAHLKADCVLVPHHGGPLSPAFGSFLSPSVFVISTGPNRWGVPRPADLDAVSGTVFRTDRQGTITAETDGKRIRWNPGI